MNGRGRWLCCTTWERRATIRVDVCATPDLEAEKKPFSSFFPHFFDQFLSRWVVRERGREVKAGGGEKRGVTRTNAVLNLTLRTRHNARTEAFSFPFLFLPFRSPHLLAGFADIFYLLVRGLQRHLYTSELRVKSTNVAGTDGAVCCDTITSQLPKPAFSSSSPALTISLPSLSLHPPGRHC